MLFQKGPAYPGLSLLQNSAVLARGPRIFPLRICSQGWARWQVLVSCVNLDQRLIAIIAGQPLKKEPNPSSNRGEKEAQRGDIPAQGQPVSGQWSEGLTPGLGPWTSHLPASLSLNLCVP